MPAPRSARRRWAGAAAVPWLVWAAVRVTGSERGFPLVPALSFTPYAAATAVVPLAVAGWARSATGAALSAGAGVALAAAVLARRGGRPVPPDAGGMRLRVATVSLRKGHARPDSVLDLVRRHDVDVLAVQELTPQAEAALSAAGIDRLLPVSHVIPARPGAVPAASGAVWTRCPADARGAVPGGFEQPTVLLRPEGGPVVELTSVHTVPPATSPSAVRQWTRDLAAFPGPADDVLRVLAGDFNATFDHAAMRAVLALGYADAAVRAGQGLAWTWRPLRLRFPRLSLDHVLIDPRIAVASVELVPVAGSDHLAVVAELVLPHG
jgi:endonuclease/exonuclease/phosphatase family metal-dependent hydrolase